MSLRLAVAPLAERDLADNAGYISKNDSGAAYRVLAPIERMADLLLKRPFIGPPVASLIVPAFER